MDWNDRNKILKEKSIVPKMKRLATCFFSFNDKIDKTNNASPWYIIYLTATSIDSMADSDSIFFKVWLLKAPMMTANNENNAPKNLALSTI